MKKKSNRSYKRKLQPYISLYISLIPPFCFKGPVLFIITLKMEFESNCHKNH